MKITVALNSHEVRLLARALQLEAALSDSEEARALCSQLQRRLVRARATALAVLRRRGLADTGHTRRRPVADNGRA